MSGTDPTRPISADDEVALACRLDVVKQASLMAEYGLLARTAVIDVRRDGSMLEVSVSRSPDAEGHVKRIVEAERACCPFMDVAVDGDAGTLVLTYSGVDAIGPVLDMIQARMQPPANTTNVSHDSVH
jgi:hypothetical protein